MSLKRLELTDELRRRLRAVEDAIAVHAPASESSDVVDIPKLQLAEAVLAAVAEQSAARLARLPNRLTPAVMAVVEVSIRPKRRRPA